MTPRISRRIVLCQLGLGAAASFSSSWLVAEQQAQPPLAEPQLQSDATIAPKPADLTMTLSQESFSRFLLRGMMTSSSFLGAAKKTGFDRVELSSHYLEFDRRNMEQKNAKPAALADEFVKASDEYKVQPVRLVISGEPPLGSPDADDKLWERYAQWAAIAQDLRIGELAFSVDAERILKGNAKELTPVAAAFFEGLQKRHEKLALLVENGPGLSSNIDSLVNVIRVLSDKYAPRARILLNIARLRYDPSQAIKDVGIATGGIVAELEGFEERGQKIHERKIDYRTYLSNAIKTTPARDVTIRYIGSQTVQNSLEQAKKLIQEVFQEVAKPSPRTPLDKDRAQGQDKPLDQESKDEKNATDKK
jgi:hypothetical protein